MLQYSVCTVGHGSTATRTNRHSKQRRNRPKGARGLKDYPCATDVARHAPIAQSASTKNVMTARGVGRAFRPASPYATKNGAFDNSAAPPDMTAIPRNRYLMVFEVDS